jgi:branched-chain amino acid transport system permease protein
MGSLIGIAVAATVMIGGTELLREMEFLKHIFGPDFTPELYRMLLFGLAMIIVMLWKPRGFVGSREPTAFLQANARVSPAALPRKVTADHGRNEYHDERSSSRSTICR